MNMESVLAFSKQLDAEISAHPCCRLFFRADEGARALTNAIFLLGTCMFLMMGSSPKYVAECFSWLEPSQFHEYSDATFSRSDFGLTFLD